MLFGLRANQIIYVFLSFNIITLYLISELFFYKLNKSYERIESNLTEVTNEQPISKELEGMIYLHTKSVSYDNYYDEEFGLNINAAVIYRKVEYCQWIEIQDEKSLKMKSKLKWTNEPISFDERNPQTRFMPDVFYTGYGHYFDSTISKDLYKNIEPTKRIDFNTNRNSNFEYIGDGWFYHSFDKKMNPSKRIKNIQSNVPKMFSFSSIVTFIIDFLLVSKGGSIYFLIDSILNEKLTKSEACDYLMSHCQAGDSRVQFLVFNPQEISVIAYKNGSMIAPIETTDVYIGNIAEGFINPHYLYDTRTKNDKAIRNSARIMVVFAVAFIARQFGSSHITKSFNMVVGGIIMGTLRSFITPSDKLNPIMWSTALVSLISMIFVTRVLMHH